MRKKKNKNFNTNKYHRDTKIIITLVSDLAKKTEGSTIGAGRAYSNKRDRKNKCSYCKTKLMGRVHAKI